ncbi:Stealth CR1 domain-containing protein [Brachybacterium alimentarium]|uniref:Stealth CR1 domain-containing protein n=1 Tax=Brachybacterium alimentarium TaxID=47845 RepID=UPI0015F02CCB|nr:Stealth CR1 domain-containing protein [Brachybacterium alimentarium]
MSTLTNRARHMGRIVTRTLRRDAERRRVRAQDKSLVARSGRPSAQFTTKPPYYFRELPVIPVDLRSPSEHHAWVLQQVVSVLRDQGIGFVEISEPGARRSSIGLRDEDWMEVLTLLTEEVPGALVGSGGSAKSASTIPYAATVFWQHRTIRRASVLVPAITEVNGQVVKRYGFDAAVGLERWERVTPTSAGEGDGETLPVTGSDDPTEPDDLAEPVDALLSEEATTLRRGGTTSPSPEQTDRDPDRTATTSRDVGQAFYAPTVWNPRVNVLPATAFLPDQNDPARVEAVAPLIQPHLFEVTFPVDVVYTWVDGTDPAWLARKRTALEQNSGETMTEDAAEDLRFVAHDELRYSLRALEQYAPWVRHIYLVTDQQRPDWLREDHPGISIVDHTDIAPAGTVLPTFNSQAIEANLHRIDGLSEHFLYFNDDVFLSSPVGPELFFNPNGVASMYLSRALVAAGEPVPGEPASDSAGKNARAVINAVTGKRVGRKLFHAPFALQRSISQEIEDTWPKIIERTRDSQFRRIADVTLSGSLHMNYAYSMGRAVTRSIRYRYVNIGAEDAQNRLASLLKDKDKLQTFCLNESTDELPPDQVDQMVRTFLERRFPDISSFEKIENPATP